MDPELKEYLDKRFTGIEERIERVETDTRQTRVVVEGLQGQIQLVAEGVVAVHESQERFREEVAKEFKDIRASMHLPYPPLDRRVTSLEGRVKKLENGRRSRKQPPSS
jgi:hypothetical protein